MTDKEKFEAVGRTFEERKAARIELAAARIRLEDYVKKLRETADAVDYFLAHPTAIAPASNRPLADQGYTWHSIITSESLPDLVHDVFAAAKRLEKAEAQAKAFE